MKWAPSTKTTIERFCALLHERSVERRTATAFASQRVAQVLPRCPRQGGAGVGRSARWGFAEEDG
ncbi:hypothetical protein [Sorangium sp. So ce363]|uniref:hypothetical protein n=1 Tax=Sorangium sp. So ce363 TaxID=3133304 RepID=UPI003F60C520